MSSTLYNKQLAEKMFAEVISTALTLIGPAGVGMGLLLKLFMLIKEAKTEAQLEELIRILRLLDHDSRRTVIDAVLQTERARAYTSGLNQGQLSSLRMNLLEIPSELQRLLYTTMAAEDAERARRARQRAEQTEANLRVAAQEGKWRQVYNCARTLRGILRSIGDNNRDAELKSIEIMAYERGNLRSQAYAIGISICAAGALIVAMALLFASSLAGSSPWLPLLYIVVEALLIRFAAKSTITGQARRNVYVAMCACPFVVAGLIIFQAIHTVTSLQ